MIRRSKETNRLGNVNAPAGCSTCEIHICRLDQACYPILAPIRPPPHHLGRKALSYDESLEEVKAESGCLGSACCTTGS